MACPSRLVKLTAESRERKLLRIVPYRTTLLFTLVLFMLPSNGRLNNFDHFVSTETKNANVPGLAYALVSGGEVTKSGFVGVLREGEAKTGSDNTVFIIGSVSKSFTALAVMQLVEKGRIKLDTQISQYLPSFVDTPIAKVTIRQLLSHTSGLSLVQGNLSQNDYSMQQDALSKRVERLARIAPQSPPGVRWEYSNANYQILGKLIEVMSGRSFAEYLENNILKPVGMNDSYVHNARANEELATGHRPWFGTRLALSSNKTGLGSAPQGGIVSSARDMARYLSVMMNKQDDILSADGKARMMSPASDISPEYGFGWFLNPDDGVVYHSGSNPGYEALATMIPSENRAAVVLANANSGFAFGQTRNLRYGINARLLAIEYLGEKTPWIMRIAYGVLVLAPLLFLFRIIIDLQNRRDRKVHLEIPRLTKLSQWWPLFFAAVLAYLLLAVVPNTFGASLGALFVFQPDAGLLLFATSFTCVIWALTQLFTRRRTKHG